MDGGAGAESPSPRYYGSGSKVDYIGFVEDDGHRNIVRAETVTIMRKMVDGTYNLHIQGYSYAKRTHDLQAFQSLEEAVAWMDLLPSTPQPMASRRSDFGPGRAGAAANPDDDTPRDSASNSTTTSAGPGNE